MSKQSYVLVVALLLATLALAACGGTSDSGDSAAPTEPGATEMAATAAADTTADTAADTAADTTAATDESSASEVQAEPASSGSETTGAGDAAGANTGGDAASATDVGSGSDGAAGSGGSDGAGGTTAPESDTGAPVEDSTTSSTESGTGGTGDAEGGTASGAAAYTAVSDAECTAIQGQLSTALGVEMTRTTGVAAFTDLSGAMGESCQLTASGTGAQFTNMVDTAALIRQTLSDNGWTVDEQYAADSPTGTLGGLRRDSQLAAYSVQWQPAAGVDCPADQPISACAETLTPEQMDYRITVDLARQ